MKSVSLAALLTLATSASGYASEPTKPLQNTQLSLYSGLTFGGEDLYRKNSNISIDTAGFFLLGAGIHIPIYEKFSMQVNLGYNFNQEDVEYSEFAFSRFEMELIPQFNVLDNLRVGVGATYHMAPTFHTELNNGFETWETEASADNTPGLIATVSYHFSKNHSLEARYVGISYEFAETIYDGGRPSPYKFQRDGNHFGISYRYSF